MHKSKIATVLSTVVLGGLCIAAPAAQAEVGVGLRGGTFGVGLDFDIGLMEKLNLRLGYNGFSYSETVDDTDVRYDGDLKISSFSALLDWHAFGGGFRFSLGGVGSGPKVDINGTPAAGQSVTINGANYDSSQVGSLRGEIKIGNSLAPYIGLGWGNVVSEKHRVTFLFDLGAIYGGTPDVTLTAVCNPAFANSNPSGCAQLKSNAQVEMQDLKDNVSGLEWYPVVSLGIGVRF